MTSTGSTATATTGTNNATVTGSSTTGSSPIYSYHNYSDTGRSMSRSSNKNNPYETPPTIHQYHSDNTSTTNTTTTGIRSTGGNSIIGDSSLLPNIGRTNQYADFALFGLAYHELMLRLQLSICLTAVLVLVVLFLTWYVQLFQPIHLVLSIVLAVLSLILVMVEGKTLWNQNNTNTNHTIFSSSSFHAAAATPSTTTTNPTTIHTVLQQLERMGTIVLYHPMGKTLYLLTCSLLCCSITGMAMFLFALWFLTNALTLIYCYVTYPECRTSFASSSSTFTTTTTENDGSHNNDNNNVGRSWSSYYSDMANTTTVASSWVSERASLLRS